MPQQQTRTVITRWCFWIAPQLALDKKQGVRSGVPSNRVGVPSEHFTFKSCTLSAEATGINQSRLVYKKLSLSFPFFCFERWAASDLSVPNIPTPKHQEEWSGERENNPNKPKPWVTAQKSSKSQRESSQEEEEPNSSKIQIL